MWPQTFALGGASTISSPGRLSSGSTILGDFNLSGCVIPGIPRFFHRRKSRARSRSPPRAPSWRCPMPAEIRLVSGSAQEPFNSPARPPIPALAQYGVQYGRAVPKLRNTSACPWRRPRCRCRPKPAGPPPHAVIKYLSAELHETPNRRPVTASHNHEPDRAPHLSRYITQGADCGGQGSGEPRASNAHWQHRTTTACVAAKLTRLCAQVALRISLSWVPMAPRQQVCAISRGSIETAIAVRVLHANAVGNPTCQVPLFQ